MKSMPVIREIPHFPSIFYKHIAKPETVQVSIHGFGPWIQKKAAAKMGFHTRYRLLYQSQAVYLVEISHFATAPSSDTRCPQRYLIAVFSALCFCKLIFSYAAQRANKIFRNIFPFRSRLNAMIRGPVGFVVFPSANFTNIFHLHFLLIGYILRIQLPGSARKQLPPASSASAYFIAFS